MPITKPLKLKERHTHEKTVPVVTKKRFVFSTTVSLLKRCVCTTFLGNGRIISSPFRENLLANAKLLLHLACVTMCGGGRRRMKKELRLKRAEFKTKGRVANRG